MGLFIKIINDGTGTNSYGNYDYQISVNDILIEKGRVEHFCRQHGAIHLAKTAILDAEEKKLNKLVETLEAFKEMK